MSFLNEHHWEILISHSSCPSFLPSAEATYWLSFYLLFFGYTSWNTFIISTSHLDITTNPQKSSFCHWNCRYQELQVLLLPCPYSWLQHLSAHQTSNCQCLHSFASLYNQILLCCPSVSELKPPKSNQQPAAVGIYVPQLPHPLIVVTMSWVFVLHPLPELSEWD